ncbi:undecaprenyl-diphosphatase UppP [Candidatus Kaiserbacteria bacterium CG10_big_fil_rev_8_21_14_0_10_45_20]|uniref:Undecaprenyl-diphosphatase n=1 Tax=Candidatus Kaiserbacteria bacterium CG10_big_fil_rev_8_21_14_0_10_45_20 TaxID=1974607 RepID=A0A2H0UGB3_9BACT|nr:MAG: undecaprenyl-diphosphatase UppP [Candidatus Kaiserbacteria bacterium CG10_big_fil_rev_8_21_14_0_10_45_20]
MDFISLIILGFVQGVTEFLPISSTGHLILAREFFGFGDAFGLAEDAVLHLATALAVVVYFKKDIMQMALAMLRAIVQKTYSRDAKMALALLVGTIPAALIGFFFQGAIETVLRGSWIVALGLVLGSVVFIVAEQVNKTVVTKKDITIKKGFVIGFFQALALIPGMSRSGMTISGGLLFGLSREEAARFGFLLSFPIILGAGSVKLFEIMQVGAIETVGAPLFAGAVVAFLSGMLAIHTLLIFIRTHTLIPFAIYRLVLAGVIIVTLVAV